MSDEHKTDFPLYNAADLTTRRRNLIRKGKSDDEAQVLERQYALAHATVGSSSEFIAWFNDIGVERRFSFLYFRPKNCPMTGQEIANPPLDTEQQNYYLLKNLPPRLAALPSFWTSYQLEMVRLNLIDPADFATSIQSSTETGRARLQKAIRRKKTNLLDACTRTVLRQLGGLPEERGYVTTFVDCRMARSWWRGHISNQVSEDIMVDIDDVWTHLRVPNATWEQISQHTVKRLTVIGDRRIRSAVIGRLMDADLENDPSNRRERVQAFLAEVGARCAHQALGVLSPSQNLSIFRTMNV